MISILSGLIGGIIAALLTTYIAKRVGKASTPGHLGFGPFMWLLGVACLAFALLPIAQTLFWNHDKDLWAKIGLFVGFGAGAVYCIAEAAFVRGTFNDEGIEFSTPWTGLKRETWEDLESLELNAWCSWYTLTFKSGTKIRLSRYLGGHLSALEMADARQEFS